MLETDPLSPGDLIRSLLEERGWSQEDLALAMKRTTRSIRALIAAQTAITTETAAALAAAFGNSTSEWLKIDAIFRASRVKVDNSDVAKMAKLLTFAPIRDMQRRGWIRETNDVSKIEADLCAFYGIDSIGIQPNLTVAPRKYDRAPGLSPPQLAWCFRARQMAASLPMSRPFSLNRVDNARAELRKLAAHAKESRRLAPVLAKYGVRFVVVEPLSGAKIDGAAFWLDEQSPVIAVSIRYDRIDAFWFTVMHEWAHISNQDTLSVDTDLVRDQEEIEDQPTLIGDPMEERANDEAADSLIPKAEIESLVGRLGPLYPRSRIIQFANRVKIHPGIVVGQLQHRRELGYSSYRGFLVKIRHTVTETSLTDGWGHSVSPTVFESTSEKSRSENTLPD